MARDYYGILGVDKDATDAEIKKAFRRQARKYHPDVNDTPEAAEKFNELKIAEEVLTNPEKRRIVDAGGDPEAPGGGFGAGGGFGGAGGFGFSDIFETFFGGSAGGRGPIPRVRPGNDALVHMTLSLEECFTGVRKEVTVDTAVLCDKCHGSGSESGQEPVQCPVCGGHGEVVTTQRTLLGNVQSVQTCHRCEGMGTIIQDPCAQCGGDGRVKKRRTVTVSIPAGIEKGMRVRLSGQGEVGPGGGPAGDLYVEVDTSTHATYVREHENLHIAVEVPMVEAALGTSVTTQDLVGNEFEIEIPAGTQPNATITVAGMGMPLVRQDARGDLLAHVTVTVPTKLDSKSEKLLGQLRSHRKESATLLNREEGGFFSRLRNKFGR